MSDSRGTEDVGTVLRSPPPLNTQTPTPSASPELPSASSPDADDEGDDAAATTAVAHHHPSVVRSAVAQYQQRSVGHHHASLRDMGGLSGWSSPAAGCSGVFAVAAAETSGTPGGAPFAAGVDSSSSEHSSDEQEEYNQLLQDEHDDDSDDGWYTSDEEDEKAKLEEAGEASDEEATPAATAAASSSDNPSRPHRRSGSLKTPLNATRADARRSPMFFARHQPPPDRRKKRQPSYAHRFPSEDTAPPTSAIENHGVIGNLHSCALVSTTGVIDWYCTPHFDSPPIFHHILDEQQGGFFRITAAAEVRTQDSAATNSNSGSGSHAPHLISPSHFTLADSEGHVPAAHKVHTKQLYMPETNVLLTRFFSDSGVGHVTDFMPLGEYADRHSARGWIVRELECVRGRMYFEVECQPTFNFGRDPHETTILPHGAMFRSESLSMLLTSSRQRLWKSTPRGGAKTRVTLDEGQRVVFVFRAWDETREKHAWEAARTARKLIERQKKFLQEQIRILRKNDAAAGLPDAAAAAAPGDPPVWSPRCNHRTIDGGAQGEAPPSPSAFSHAVSPIHPPRGVHPPQLHVPPPVQDHKCDPLPSHVAPGRHCVNVCEPNVSGDYDDPSLCKKWGLHTLRPIDSRRTDRLRRRTTEYWRAWLERFSYEGRWREQLQRCALMLKLLTFEPTGAIIQTPTCGLPNARGVAGFDGRCVSLRDASFTVCAFLKMGFRQEAAAYMNWLEQRCDEVRAEVKAGKPATLQLMYGLRGERDLTPVPLPSVAGYKHSGGVHTGNPNFNRDSLDFYGALLISIYVTNKYAEAISYEMWIHTRTFVEQVIAQWREPMQGPWFSDGQDEKRHWTTSKVMAYVAIDRGIRLAQERSFPADIIEWKRQRNLIYEDVMAHGYNAKLGRFTQAYDNTNLDALLMLLSTCAFVTPTDPKFARTLDAMFRTVSEDGLLSHSQFHRYNEHDTANNNDSMGKVPPATAPIASFWAIEACTQGGLATPRQLDRARMLMEQMLGQTNHIGLFGVGMGPRGEFVGNYPDALTHAALVRGAMFLNKALRSPQPRILDPPLYEA